MFGGFILTVVVNNQYQYGLCRLGTCELSDQIIELPVIAAVNYYQELSGINFNLVIDETINARKTKGPNKFYILHAPNPMIAQTETYPVPDLDTNSEIEKNSIIIPGMVNYPDSFNELGLFPENIFQERFNSINSSAVKVEIITGDQQSIMMDSGLALIYNAIKLLSNPRSFVKRILSIKPRLHSQVLLYFPGVATVSNLAVMVYLGADILDDIQCILHARAGLLMTNSGPVHYLKSYPGLCTCPGCIRREELTANSNETENKTENHDIGPDIFDHILMHNELSLMSELSNVKSSLKAGTLRQLVEQRMAIDTNNTSLIRVMDLEHFNELEHFFPVVSNSPFISCTLEALNRVEVIRFRDRVVKRYRKPENAKVLILLPCSAKKPYSTSKSHKKFFEAIDNSIRTINGKNNMSQLLHEMIITSPLGLVPRELELVYPAQQYDIPVTGHWFEDELQIIRNMLSEYLTINEYDKVIVHLGPKLDAVVEECIKSNVNPPPETIMTTQGGPTEKKSLDNLSKELITVFEEYKNNGFPAEHKTPYLEILSRIAQYQFGTNMSAFLDGCKVKGKYPNLKIFQNGVQLGMLTGERGFISLTLAGAEKLMKMNGFKYFIEIDDFIPKGSIMSIGILSASEDIRAGDEVVACHDGAIRAVGQAVVSGVEMVKNRRGMAVKVRHHI